MSWSGPLEKKIRNFLAKVEKSHLNQRGRSLAEKALFFAVDAHNGDTRLSGEEFIFHPISVAEFLLEAKQTAEIIAAGLLHDVVEDTIIPLSEIRKNFGDEVSFYVDGMTKVFSSFHVDRIEEVFGQQVAFAAREMVGSEKISLVDKDIIYRAKLITFARQNYRVVFIRLADRIHNLRTVKSLSISKQRSVAQETLEFHIPLAREFIPKKELKSINFWISELESLASKCLNPEVRGVVTQRSAMPCLSAS